MRSFALWRKVPATADEESFCQGVEAAFTLSPEHRRELRSLVSLAFSDSQCQYEPKEFIARLKLHDRTHNPGRERWEHDRFDVDGVMDGKIRKVFRHPDARNHVSMAHRRPSHELGEVTVNPPYGILGDAERMAALISSSLDLQHDTLRNALQQRQVPPGSGRVDHKGFAAALSESVGHIFASDITKLLAVVDPKRLGWVHIASFLRGSGLEYLKKKADRKSLSGDPLIWEVNNNTTTTDKAFKPPRAKLRCSPNRSYILRRRENSRNQRFKDPPPIVGFKASPFCPAPPRGVTKEGNLRAIQDYLQKTTGSVFSED